MDRRLENASSDFVASIIYYGEDRLSKDTDQGFAKYFKSLLLQEKKLMIEGKIRSNMMKSLANEKVNMDIMDLMMKKANTNIFRKTFDMGVDDDSSDLDRDNDDKI
jgi:hypothetical protein